MIEHPLINIQKMPIVQSSCVADFHVSEIMTLEDFLIVGKIYPPATALENI
jgi:hypothetical protein